MLKDINEFLQEIKDKDNQDRRSIIQDACMYWEDKEDFDPEEFDVNKVRIRPARPFEMLCDFEDRYRPWLKSF